MGEPADRHPGLRQHLIGRDRQTGRLVGITSGVGGTTGRRFVLDAVDVVDRSAGVEHRELPPG
jgi:hypothetical protein